MQSKRSVQQLVDKRLSKMESYKVYGYAELGLDGKDPSVRSAISRRKDRVRSLGRGKFYVSLNDSKVVYEVAHDKIALKRNSVSVKKIHASRNLYWSNPDGYILVENAIAIAIEKGSMDDVAAMRYRFGDKKVIKVLLEQFDPSKPKIKRMIRVIRA